MRKKREIKINLDKIEAQGYSLNEILYLYLRTQKHFNSAEFWNKLLEGKNILWDKNTHTWTFNDDELEKLVTTCFNIKKNNQQQEIKWANVAPQLIELYPTGIKPGTGNPWRGSKQQIVTRLCSLEDRLQINLDPQEVINATKMYIETYRNDQRTMRTLPYFIWKNDVVNGEYEFKSDLIAFIDCLRDGVIPEPETDWISQLR